MAKQIAEKEESSVRLIDLQVSEDELTVYISALKHLLENYNDPALERICGAYRDEVEGIVDDLVGILGNIEPVERESYLDQPAPAD